MLSNLTARIRAIEWHRLYILYSDFEPDCANSCNRICDGVHPSVYGQRKDRPTAVRQVHGNFFFQVFTILLSTLVNLCTEERSTVTDSCQSSARQSFSFLGNILGHWPYINCRCSEPVQVRFLQGVFLLVQNLSPWSMSFWAYGSNLYSNLVLKYRSWPSSE